MREAFWLNTITPFPVLVPHKKIGYREVGGTLPSFFC
nr:MAG TPA: hypothetical protein [Caudoviricetes sp.]